ncbi:extensin family protein [Roseomonas sp. NAR14]|uniref:Extensin family protein n=1 Tax=Roseomonas acroporae TaxID=2937791 RepID=A0A9X1Y7K9_9PROT|nr:extensin family protein [Roseomonas acroporae]MCK8784971.1 extensin family protein [Roseomonas acroporae]
MRTLRRLLAALLGLGMLALLAALAIPHLPPRWNPLAPLDLRAPPNLLTGWKLARLGADPAACLAAFAASDLALPRLPDVRAGGDCVVSPAVRLEPGATLLRPAGPVGTCRLAAAWEMFARHSLQPAAQDAFGQPVVAVRHVGTFACRDVAGTARRSRHATADAIDVAGFTLRDGRQVSVLGQWSDAGPAGQFLRAAHAGACRWFGTVLGPDYNAAHRDHFHLDVGGWHACR